MLWLVDSRVIEDRDAVVKVSTVWVLRSGSVGHCEVISKCINDEHNCLLVDSWEPASILVSACWWWTNRPI